VENAKQAWIADSRPQVPLVELASREFQFLQRGAASDLASFVVWPFRVAELEQAISDAVHKCNSGIHENLVAFLPGKAGSGACAVTFHTALVVAKELERRVLVDGLHSSTLAATMLAMTGPLSSCHDARNGAQGVRPESSTGKNNREEKRTHTNLRNCIAVLLRPESHC
jgi:hypothetical protein